MPGALRIGLLLLLCVLHTGCYLPSAMRRSGRIVQSGFDTTERGGWVVLTGPGSIVLAAADGVVNAFIPINYDGYFVIDRREPDPKWFHLYPGPMRGLKEVAVLCHLERATSVRSIRSMDTPDPDAARHERWHFPRCLEVLPGRYELEVHYFVRRTENSLEVATTEHAESTEPSRVIWHAEAGGLYRLKAIVGQTSQASGAAPRSKVSRKSSLGTSTFELIEGEWAAQIERLPSWAAFDEPIRDYRQRWVYYEEVK
jgi:hypothetical protein